MKHLLTIIASTFLLLIVAAACRTNEANYRAAYEVAKEKQQTAESDLDQELLDRQAPRPTVIGGDTLPLRTEFIGYTKGGGADTDKSVVKKYCVIVGKFKQVFNARSMRERLIQSGYPRALVLHNNIKEYYVIANTTPDHHTARLMLDSVKADPALLLKAPYPYILQPGHIAR